MGTSPSYYSGAFYPASESGGYFSGSNTNSSHSSKGGFDASRVSDMYSGMQLQINALQSLPCIRC